MCLGIWLEKPNYGREVDTGTLYAELSEIAKREGLMLSKTAAAWKTSSSAKKAIELTLDIKIAGAHTSHTSKWRFLPAGEEYSKNSSENALPAHSCTQ